MDPSPQTPQNCPYVVFDTELTGLNEQKDTLLSIGALRMKGGSLLLGETFHRLIKPSNPITPQSVVIHQITPSDVHAEAPAQTVLEEFFQFCGPSILVGHFVQIDIEFISKETDEILNRPRIDTVSLL